MERVEVAVGSWERISETAAARQWGTRHYRWYAARRYGPRAAPGVLILLAAGGLVVAIWQLGRSELAPVYALVAACGLIVGFFVRLAWLISPRARVVRGSGGLIPMIICAAVLLVIAVMI